MSWLFRLGAFCALLGAFACTGNPKPLPPNNAEDANMMQDGNIPPQDANAGSDSFVPHPDAAVDAGRQDAGPPDATVDGGHDGAVDGGADGAVDGGADGTVGVNPRADSGLFVRDGGLKRKDGGDIIIPPPPND